MTDHEAYHRLAVARTIHDAKYGFTNEPPETWPEWIWHATDALIEQDLARA